MVGSVTVDTTKEAESFLIVEFIITGMLSNDCTSMALPASE
jgi:serine protease inhibitor ecotin